MAPRLQIIPFVPLNDGNKIPIIGLGTFELAPGGQVETAVQTAIDVGYRHFDCADFHQNEEGVGAALKKAMTAGKVKREELWLTTKVWPNWFAKGRPTASVKRSLQKLCTEYVDLLLIHWPFVLKQDDKTFYPKDSKGQALFDDSIQLVDVWKELEQIKKDGLTRSIGVSNFNSKQLEDLIKKSSTVPAINQVECHPYLTQDRLRTFCKEKGIHVAAYSPLARAGTAERKTTSSPLDIPVIKEIARNHKVSPAAVCIKWQAQRGVIVVCKSKTSERILTNIQIFHFELTADEMEKIKKLNKDLRNNTFTQYGINKHKNWPFSIPF